ncbi:MAG: RIP metalloprotease RseP [bacterium]|nr:RIP metalloprotease RseP [bacterium]
MSIIIMLLLLSVLILVHEAGHFATARMFGIKVDKFGFGLPIGPTLFKTKLGETEILVHAFLLGGYVSFPDDDKDCDLPEDSPERFLNRPIHERAIVISAGVIANIVIAFVLVFMTAILWGHLPSGKYSIKVQNIVAPKEANVWKSGLKNGDIVKSINGVKIENSFALLSIVGSSKSYDGKIYSALLEKNYNKLKELNPPLLRDEIIPPQVAVLLPDVGLEPQVVLSEKVSKGLKYDKDTQIKLSDSQIKLRDELIGKKVYVSDGVYTLNDIAYAISDSWHPLDIVVERDGKLIALKSFAVDKSGKIGIQLASKEIYRTTNTPFTIMKYGTKYLIDSTYSLCYGLYQIFTGQIPLKDLHGIVAITKVGGDIIQNNGIFSGLLLTALISINLAIVNFLPIPALDGGHIMFIIIEKIKGSRVSEAVIEKFSAIGFLFLIALMLLVIVNDIVGIVTKKF